MSSPADFAQQHKLETDRAVSRAFARLMSNARAHSAFVELLACVRCRAPDLLAAPIVDGEHPGVEALGHLSQCAGTYLRPIACWPGTDGSWRCAVDGLAQHLVARYPSPRFLSAAWYAADTELGAAKRRWFVTHTAGTSFRSLDVPIAMTRRMESIFLRSRDHLPIEYAMRRAELLGLGCAPELADAVLVTRRASDLTNGRFWRSVWFFFIAHSHEIGTEQIGPLVDFLQSVRHERMAVETAAGIVMRDPPQPDFSLKGRTPRSLMRLMEDWHRNLGLVSGGLSWDASRFHPLAVEFPAEDASMPPVTWEVTELTNSAQLRAEGTALRHCVASYALWCHWGRSRIWSVRRRRGSVCRPVATVEVDPRRRLIVQARGFCNRRAGGRALQVIQSWATREGLRLAL